MHVVAKKKKEIPFSVWTGFLKGEDIKPWEMQCSHFLPQATYVGLHGGESDVNIQRGKETRSRERQFLLGY